MKTNPGFSESMQKKHEHEDDFVLGSDKQPDLKGMSDEVAGVVWALHAWSRPVNGVYPRSENNINHASLGINNDSKLFLPKGTVQRGSEDWMNCTSNAPCNELETQFNSALKNNKFSPSLVKWFEEVGFIVDGKFEIADAWVSIGSGNTRNGNSLKNPVDFIHKSGIVPKSKMPDDKSMSWGTYHDKARITPELKAIADEILKYISFNYERIYYKDFTKYTKDLKWEDFDSYVDPVDGDFIKKLAPDYKFMGYGYHLTINQIGEPEPNYDSMAMELIKGEEKPEVYLVSYDGVKHHVDAPSTFDDLFGKISWQKIVTRPQSEVDEMIEGMAVSTKGQNFFENVKLLIQSFGKKGSKK